MHALVVCSTRHGCIPVVILEMHISDSTGVEEVSKEVDEHVVCHRFPPLSLTAVALVVAAVVLADRRAAPPAGAVDASRSGEVWAREPIAA